MSTLRVAIAGTTHRTTQCAQALLGHSDISIEWILTPEPKPIGRKQVVTPNPLDEFATKNKIARIHVSKKIDSEVKKQLLELPKPDILLVVDFGYIVPDWLLFLPKIAPVNIHPSQLPKWRGSSPGQFAILYNNSQSAATVMAMDSQLDHGPIITQIPFEIDPNWNHEGLYMHAFNLVAPELPNIFLRLQNAFSETGSISELITPQPDATPTPIARQLKKNDAYVPWEIVAAAMSGETPKNLEKLLPSILHDAYQSIGSLSVTLERASKAFSPWPNLWTTVQTKSGETRMKLLRLAVKNSGELEIVTVQLAGKNSGPWKQIKSGILNISNI